MRRIVDGVEMFDADSIKAMAFDGYLKQEKKAVRMTKFAIIVAFIEGAIIGGYMTKKYIDKKEAKENGSN